MAGAVAESLDLARLGGTGRGGGRAARLPLRAAGVSGAPPAGRSPGAAGGTAAAGRGARLSLSLRRERVPDPRRGRGPRPGARPVAAQWSGSHPAGACVFVLRVLLSPDA